MSRMAMDRSWRIWPLQMEGWTPIFQFTRMWRANYRVWANPVCRWSSVEVESISWTKNTPDVVQHVHELVRCYYKYLTHFNPTDPGSPFENGFMEPKWPMRFVSVIVHLNHSLENMTIDA